MKKEFEELRKSKYFKYIVAFGIIKKAILLVMFLVPLLSFSQEYFFMDNGSYETTTTYMLSTNSSDNADNDLSISYVKDRQNQKYIVLKSEYILKAYISNIIFIYLKNGTAIEIIEPFNFDYIDGFMVSMYPLSNENISKIVASEIHSIRYTNSSSRKKVSASNRNWLLGKALKEFL